MRTADDFKQEEWETLGGAAAQIARVERTETAKSSRIPYHTGIDPVSAARGRANSAAIRKQQRRKVGEYTS